MYDPQVRMRPARPDAGRVLCFGMRGRQGGCGSAVWWDCARRGEEPGTDNEIHSTIVIQQVVVVGIVKSFGIDIEQKNQNGNRNFSLVSRLRALSQDQQG